MSIKPTDAPLQFDGDLMDSDSGNMREQLEAWAVALLQDTSQPMSVRIDAGRLLNEVLATRPVELSNAGYWQVFGQAQAVEEIESGTLDDNPKLAPVLKMYRNPAPGKQPEEKPDE